MLNLLWPANKQCTFKMIQVKLYTFSSVRCSLVWHKAVSSFHFWTFQWFMLFTCQRNGSSCWLARVMVHVVHMTDEWFILLTCQRNGSCSWHDRWMVHVLDMPGEFFMLLTCQRNGSWFVVDMLLLNELQFTGVFVFLCLLKDCSLSMLFVFIKGLQLINVICVY